jgi:hypothetical protein
MPRYLTTAEEFAPAFEAYLNRVNRFPGQYEQIDTVIGGKVHVDITVTPIPNEDGVPYKNMVLAVTRRVQGKPPPSLSPLTVRSGCNEV